MYNVILEAYIPRIVVGNENEYKEESNIRRGEEKM
jgi:hypothetical protein